MSSLSLFSALEIGMHVSIVWRPKAYSFSKHNDNNNNNLKFTWEKKRICSIKEAKNTKKYLINLYEWLTIQEFWKENEIKVVNQNSRVDQQLQVYKN